MATRRCSDLTLISASLPTKRPPGHLHVANVLPPEGQVTSMSNTPPGVGLEMPQKFPRSTLVWMIAACTSRVPLGPSLTANAHIHRGLTVVVFTAVMNQLEQSADFLFSRSQIIGFADLLQPVSHTPLVCLLHRKVNHSGFWACAVPVLFARWNPDRITSTDRLR